MKVNTVFHIYIDKKSMSMTLSYLHLFHTIFFLHLDAELIMKCSTCHRWYHGECDSIQNEADAEKCAEETYECPFCRPEDALPPHLIGNNF